MKDQFCCVKQDMYLQSFVRKQLEQALQKELQLQILRLFHQLFE
jgi:hypothetical protein